MTELPDQSGDEPRPYREHHVGSGSSEKPGSLGGFFFYFVLVICILISVYLRLFSPPAAPKASPINSKITML